MTLDELAISTMRETSAPVELLERKGVLTKQDVLDMIHELRRRNSTALVSKGHHHPMAKTIVPKSGGPDSGGTHPLWTFITAISGVSDELERARLTATGLPSLLSCRLSGIALFL